MSRSEQSSSAENELVAVPDSSSNRSGGESSQVSLRKRHNGGGAAIGSNTIVYRVNVDSSGQGGWRSEHRGRTLQGIECLITTESAQYGLEDPSCRLSARSSRCGYPSIMKCGVDIRKNFVRQGRVVPWRRVVPRDC